MTATNHVLVDVAAERSRQHAQWGEQNLPDGTGLPGQPEIADRARRLCDRAAAVGVLTWSLIMQEEMFEALAETDPAKLRAELIQVAAVAVQWVEAIDRRSAS